MTKLILDIHARVRATGYINFNELVESMLDARVGRNEVEMAILDMLDMDLLRLDMDTRLIFVAKPLGLMELALSLVLDLARDSVIDEPGQDRQQQEMAIKIVQEQLRDKMEQY